MSEIYCNECHEMHDHVPEGGAIFRCMGCDVRKKFIIVNNIQKADKTMPALFIEMPEHYTSLTPEPGLVIDSWNLGWYVSNAIKYLVRAHSKGDQLNDLLKARQYLDMEIKKIKQRSELGELEKDNATAFTSGPIKNPDLEQ